MKRLRSKAVIALTVLGLMAMSGIAIADGHEQEKNDTVGNYAYDADRKFFFWNATSLQTPIVDYDTDYATLLDECTLGADTYGYSLTAGEITLDPAVSEDCSPLNGGFIFGPNGQTNHGQLMKLVNSLIEGQGRGCIIREIAKSGVGKEDRQTADPEFVAPDPAEAISGTVAFTTFETDCLHGKKGANEAGGQGGPPAHVLQKKAEKQAQKWPDGKPGKGPKNGR